MKNIPWGCHTKYIPGLTSDATELLDEYEQLYNIDPFSDDTSKQGLK